MLWFFGSYLQGQIDSMNYDKFVCFPVSPKKKKKKVQYNIKHLNLLPFIKDGFGSILSPTNSLAYKKQYMCSSAKQERKFDGKVYYITWASIFFLNQIKL